MTQVPAMLVNNLIQKKPLSVGPIERRYAIYLYCRQQGKWNEYVSGMDPMFNRSKLEALCPIRHVGSEYPPTMLLHGDQDEDVPYKESADMAEALNQANVPHQFITIPGGKHVFDEHMQEPAVKDAFSQVLAFLNEYV
jgi:dipeptidyl aminopeptidase/acylaminoacyl peptidase